MLSRPLDHDKLRRFERSEFLENDMLKIEGFVLELNKIRYLIFLTYLPANSSSTPGEKCRDDGRWQAENDQVLHTNGNY